MALIGLAVPAQGRIAGHTISPAGLMDTRINFVPPVAAVFVVDNAKGQIGICYPDNKVCPPATTLP
jgi:hypothetical protein